MTSAPVCPTAVDSLLMLLPALSANVRKQAAFLPRIVGRLAILPSAQGCWPTTKNPCVQVPISTMSACSTDARSGAATLDKPVIDQPSCDSFVPICSAAFHVFPVRLSTSSAAFIARDDGTRDGRQSFLSGAQANERCF